MRGRPKDYAEVPAPGRWTDRALCKGRGEEFFASYGSLRRAVPLRISELCGACPVRKECLAYALAHRPQGIWAGTSEEQRHRMIQRTNQQPQGATA